MEVVSWYLFDLTSECECYEYSTIMAKLCNLLTWTTQVNAAGRSLGRVCVNHGGGDTKVGPFNGRQWNL